MWAQGANLAKPDESNGKVTVGGGSGLISQPDLATIPWSQNLIPTSYHRQNHHRQCKCSFCGTTNIFKETFMQCILVHPDLHITHPILGWKIRPGLKTWNAAALPILFQGLYSWDFPSKEVFGVGTIMLKVIGYLRCAPKKTLRMYCVTTVSITNVELIKRVGVSILLVYLCKDM